MSSSSSSVISSSSFTIAASPLIFSKSQAEKEAVLNGIDKKSGKTVSLKIVQVKEKVYILNAKTGEVAESFFASELSFDEVLETYMQASGLKIAAVVPQQETAVSKLYENVSIAFDELLETYMQESGLKIAAVVSQQETAVSKLDKNVSITSKLGCVTLITAKSGCSVYGHTQIVFEAIQERRYVMWLADIYLPERCSKVPSGFANIRVKNLTGKELGVSAQTETWALATEKIQKKIQELEALEKAKKQIVFFRTGKGTRGVPIDGNNCFTWAEEVLADLGIELYKDVYNVRTGAILRDLVGASCYISPASIIGSGTIYSQRRVVVEIAVQGHKVSGWQKSNIPKADVTKKIHEIVKEMSWKCNEGVYPAAAKKNEQGKYCCLSKVKIPVIVRNSGEQTVDVTEEVERQLNIPPMGGFFACLSLIFESCERSAFDQDTAKVDLAYECKEASRVPQFWNGWV